MPPPESTTGTAIDRSPIKAGTSTIPPTIAMMCRAMLRDPLIMQADQRPRKAGRPAA
jgi:hypothetical protein